MNFMLNKSYTLDTFFSDDDVLALKIAKTIYEKPMINPIYIYGEVGSGKTHLLQAIGNELLKNEKIVIYTSAASFTDEFIQHIVENRMNKFKEKFTNIDALLIDDFHFFENKSETTKELNYIFDYLYNKNIQMAFTSGRQITELKMINARMISRIGGGLIIKIPPLNFDTKCSIIKNIANVNEVKLEPNEIEKIANNVSNDTRRIISEIIRIKFERSQSRE
jgi:chromosomal replication initiator protein